MQRKHSGFKHFMLQSLHSSMKFPGTLKWTISGTFNSERLLSGVYPLKCQKVEVLFYVPVKEIPI